MIIIHVLETSYLLVRLPTYTVNRTKRLIKSLLHTGTTLEWLAPDVLAAPWWRVL